MVVQVPAASPSLANSPPSPALAITPAGSLQARGVGGGSGQDRALISTEWSLKPVAPGVVLLCKGHCCLHFSLLCLN